ncbi:EAL domain-containing protein [Ochrobactrum pseudogrignonense]|nr:EAL domain-containing protein [Brucella pseudogrignonensis]
MLYGECLARLLNRDGTVTSAREFIPILDIWGKTPLLDQHMIKLVLDELTLIHVPFWAATSLQTASLTPNGH